MITFDCINNWLRVPLGIASRQTREIVASLCTMTYFVGDFKDGTTAFGTILHELFKTGFVNEIYFLVRRVP